MTYVATQDDRNLGMLAHLLAFAGLVIPLGSILGPLVLYLVKRDQSPFVSDHARESLNFQLTLFLAALVCVPLCFVLIGFALLFALFVLEIVQVIKATIAASEGRNYDYPFCLRLV